VVDAHEARVSADGLSLSDVVQEALRGPSAFVLVEPDAGLGLADVLAELEVLPASIRLGAGTCSPAERHLPYAPLAHALRGALAAESDGVPGVLSEILAGAPVGSSSIDALESLAELIDEHVSLVLVLDGVHEADPATLASLGYLRRRCAGAHLTLVGISRPQDARERGILRRLEPTALIRFVGADVSQDAGG
jgi:hypothetical protein